MTNEEYVKKLMMLSGIKSVEDGVWRRKLKLTVAKDRYGDPSSIILSFEGTPPRLEVYTRIGNEAGMVIVGYKIIKPTGHEIEKAVLIKKFIHDFVRDRFKVIL